MKQYDSVVLWETHALPTTEMTIEVLEDGGSVAGIIPNATVQLPRDQRAKLVFTKSEDRKSL
jgi:hypothetical protein